MSTVILEWNPSFSSYSILRYLQDLYYTNKNKIMFQKALKYHPYDQLYLEDNEQ